MITVLLIEDNADDVELAVRAFDRVGLSDQIHVAKDGEEGLCSLIPASGTKHLPSIQLVLLDLNLPKTSGLDVLRQIRLHPATRNIPVVILTASKTDPDLLQSFTMGVKDYLIKPLDPMRFSQLHDKYVRKSK